MEDERPPQGHGRHGEAAGWMYFTEREHTSNLVRPTVEAKAGHVYTNDDVTRQNDKNGEVRYDGKREKL
jgi:hypothetical protein